VTAAARRRSAVWATGDAASELRQAEFELDAIDLEVAGLRRIRVERSRALLRDLGFDFHAYRPLSLPRPIQQRCSSHPPDDLLAERALIVSAQRGGRRDPRYLSHDVGGVVTGVR
jgi:hypothetical protein